MNELTIIGKNIKDKRLSLNLRMDDVAKSVGVTRPTMWAIEKGTGNYSIQTLIKVINYLGLSLELTSRSYQSSDRHRATRINAVINKKINRFVIMCVEQYASYCKKSSKETYKDMRKFGVIDELTNDYEDLHGMSTAYLNGYIDALINVK